jgi:hypothetical protein
MYDKRKGLLARWYEEETVKVPTIWRDETIKVAVVPVWMLDTVSMPVVKAETRKEDIAHV